MRRNLKHVRCLHLPKIVDAHGCLCVHILKAVNHKTISQTTMTGLVVPQSLEYVLIFTNLENAFYSQLKIAQNSGF